MGGGFHSSLGRLPRTEQAFAARYSSLSVRQIVALLFLGCRTPVIVAFSHDLSSRNARSSDSTLASTTPRPTNDGYRLDGEVHTLLLCRHGDSIWNGGEPGTRETFTGWTNVPLSRKGIKEAKATGKQVAKYFELPCNHGGNNLDACFTSILQRAQLTAHYCLWGESAGYDIPNHPFILRPPKYFQDYRLNERHYGALQGYVKEDVEQGLYGHDPQLVRRWRKSWSTVPPLLLDDNDPRRIQELRHYASHCGGPQNVPRGESLEQVANERIRPFMRERLCPVLQQASKNRRGNGGVPSTIATSSGAKVDSRGGTGLIVAHANSLRALIGVICNVQDEPKALRKLESLRLQTAVPLVLRFRIASGTDVTADGQGDPNSRHITIDQYYQPCDLDGIPFVKDGDSYSKRRQLVPELPLYPLSGILMTKSTVRDQILT